MSELVSEETPAQRLDRFIDTGKLIRKAWGDGFEKACLLAAMAPQCAVMRKTEACPASLCPRWWASLTLPIDDFGSDGAWPSMVRRYAKLAHRWHCLNSTDWLRLRAAVYKSAIELHIEADDEGPKTMGEKEAAQLHEMLNVLELFVAGNLSEVEAARELERGESTWLFKPCSLCQEFLDTWSAQFLLDLLDDEGIRPDGRTKAELWDELTDDTLMAMEGLCDKAEYRIPIILPASDIPCARADFE